MKAPQPKHQEVSDDTTGGGHTAGPWYAIDQRASTLRRLGWAGEHHDAILISNYAPADIRDDHCDCIVARITFANRTEELGDSNMADARLIAAAPDMYDAHDKIANGDWLGVMRFAEDSDGDFLLRVIAKMRETSRAAIAKATGHD